MLISRAHILHLHSYRTRAGGGGEVESSRGRAALRLCGIES